MALTFKSAQLAGQQIAQQTGSMAANQLRPIAAGLNPGILSSPTSILQASGATPIEQETNALVGGIGRSVMGAFNSSTSEGLLKKLVTGTKHVGDVTIGLLKSINKNTKQAAGGGIGGGGGAASEFKEKAFKRRDWSKPSRYGPAAEMQAFLKKGGGLISDADLEKLTRLFSEERKIAEEKENARAQAHANKEAARRKKFETQKERKEKRKAALEKFVSSKPVRAAAFMGGNLADATKGVVKTTTGFLSWLLSPKNLLIAGSILSGIKSLLTNWLESDEFSLASFIEGATFGMVKAETAQKVIDEIKAVLVGTKEEPGLLFKALSTYKDLLGIDQADGAFAGTLGIIGTGLKNFFIGTEEKGYKDGLLGIGYNSIRKVLKDQGVTDNLPNIKDISMGGAAVGAVIGAALTGGVGLIPGAIIGALAPGYLKKKYSDPGGPFDGLSSAFTMGGAIIGAGIGFQVGGPAGALIGAIIGGMGTSVMDNILRTEGMKKNIMAAIDLADPEKKELASKNFDELTDSQRKTLNMLDTDEQRRILLSENFDKDRDIIDWMSGSFGDKEFEKAIEFRSGASSLSYQLSARGGKTLEDEQYQAMANAAGIEESRLKEIIPRERMVEISNLKGKEFEQAIDGLWKTVMTAIRVDESDGQLNYYEMAEANRVANKVQAQNISTRGIVEVKPTGHKYDWRQDTNNELGQALVALESVPIVVAEIMKAGLENIAAGVTSAASQQQSGPGVAVSLNPPTPTREASHPVD